MKTYNIKFRGKKILSVLLNNNENINDLIEVDKI